MLRKLLIATLAIGAAAFKLERPVIKPQQSRAALGLQLRGGADVTEIAKYVTYFTSAFMFLPAGRDVVSPGAEIMPDDDKLIGKMFTDTSKDGYVFMWNQWGVNWIMLSIMKIMAVKSGNADFIKLGFAADAAAVLIKLEGPSLYRQAAAGANRVGRVQHRWHP